MRKVFVTVLALALFAGFIAACPAEADKTAIEDINPGFIYIGPPGDGGWTYMQEKGRQEMEKSYPGLKSYYIESVPEGPEAVPAMERLIRSNRSKLVFACSFGYMDYVLEVAEKYPDVTFIHISGYKRAANVGTMFGRMYQPRYLAGLAAGKMSKSGKIGYVAAYPLPEVIRMINAFTVGARETNPNATVSVVWLFSWFDPGKEKEAAKALIDSGCDLLAMHADTGAVAQASEEAGVYVIGYNNDMISFAPKMHLTAPIWDWGKMFSLIVGQLNQGTWKSDAIWWGLKEGAVDLAPFGPAVTDDVKTLVSGKKADIISGKWDVFTGPVKNQAGEVKIPEGKSMTDDEIWNMDWFVEGVKGDIPK
ncbi:MAG: BMP family ABC transporter substrate-binding protein [Synergistaceae bacterium]|nr:BMP family ABC transporter substrate-binding protein [Synergistaceae bacterium]